MPLKRAVRPLSLARTLGVGALLLGLAACGSQLAPDQVVGAGGAVAGSTGGAPGAVVGDDPAAVVGGDAGAVVDPGTGSVPVAGVPGAATGGGDTGTAGAPTGNGKVDDAAKPDDKASKPPKATGDLKPGSCEGLKNTTGITDSTITIGNASDISGPVPGLFEAAQQATKAYVAYFNATSDICGRKLALATYDSRTDAAADQQAYTQGCSEAFAMVGSMSGFDGGGAATAQSCGLPDLRAISTTADRGACTTCFAAQSAGPGQFENAVPDFLINNAGGGQHGAMLYLDGGAAAENGKTQAVLGAKRGMKFDYVQGIPLAEFNYTPYVQKMKSLGIETVQFVGAIPQFVRLAQAMKAQSFVPKAFLLDPTAYNPDYVSSGSSAVDGTYIFTNFTPFEEVASSPELKLYLSYLQQVSPGAKPTFFGLFAWSAARLFSQEAAKLGGQLSRASLIADLKTVDNWTDNGLHAPQHVGTKQVGDCWRFLQLKGTTWAPVGSTEYTCSGVTS